MNIKTTLPASVFSFVVNIVSFLQLYPTEELPQFQTVVTELFKECSRVALKILEVMGYSLGLPVSHGHLYTLLPTSCTSLVCLHIALWFNFEDSSGGGGGGWGWWGEGAIE